MNIKDHLFLPQRMMILIIKIILLIEEKNFRNILRVIIMINLFKA